MSLQCSLCNVQLNSQSQFDQHMHGKSHLKKLKAYNLDGQDHSAASAPQSVGCGEMVPAGTKRKGNWSFCEVCGIELSSPTLANDHYRGAKHAKKLKASHMFNKIEDSVKHVKDGDPSGAGDFSMMDSDGGTLPPPPPPPLAPPPPPPPPLRPSSNTGGTENNWTLPAKLTTGSYFCTVCSLEFTSHEQAQAHFRGGKHARKLKTAQSRNFDLSSVVQRGPARGETTSTSTGFYCSFCDLQLNSQFQLSQHREGSKHKQNLEKSRKSSCLPPRPARTTQASYASFTCALCCLAFASASKYEQHLGSPEHQTREMGDQWPESESLLSGGVFDVQTTG